MNREMTSDAFMSRIQRHLASERASFERRDSLNVHDRQYRDATVRNYDPEHADAILEQRANADFVHFVTTGDPGALIPAGSVEYRDLGAGTGAAGGFMVAADFQRKLTVAEAAWSAMRQVANVVLSATGAPMPEAAVDDSATSGSILAENVAIGASTDVTVSTRTFSAFDYVSPVIRFSIQMESDTINLVDNIAWLCGQRLGRIQNTHFTTGTGTGQPLGLFTAGSVPVGATSAGPTAITWADIVALYGSVDPAYLPTSTWMMNQATHTAVRALVGSSGVPLIPAGDPTTLLGRPVVINPAMAGLTATALSVGFGDVSRAYTIRDVGAASFHHLAERYMDALAHGAFVVHRSDGQPSGDQRAFKTLAQHA